MAILRDYVNYATGTAVTISLVNLPSTSARCSTAIVVDTAAGYYTDYMGIVTLQSTTGTHAAGFAAYVYMYGGSAGVVNYPATTADVAVTIATDWNLAGPVIMNFGTSLTGSKTITNIFFVKPLFGGEMPAQFGVLIDNEVGINLSATAGNNTVTFVPVYHTIT